VTVLRLTLTLTLTLTLMLLLKLTRPRALHPRVRDTRIQSARTAMGVPKRTYVAVSIRRYA